MTDKKQLKGITVHQPIVYGSVATMIPFEERIADPDHNMRWTVALRSATSPPPDSDILRQRPIEGDIIGGADNLSHFITKVSFKIHNFYPNPLRMIDRGPYEINETGWEPNETFYHRMLSNPMTRLPIKNRFLKHLVQLIGPKVECGKFSLEIKEKEFKKLSLAKMKVLIETNQLRGALVRSKKELNETKRFI
ncbi:hypothetical protein BY996DRAFT_6430810 [Phakopsora pachyrhizi]|uniref:Protein AF-9 homolog n=1 Tax=Phakopsora pachyrhizi TaxID=170000 RepID=A0AAV0AWT6_PHAPC|nr:hypothetical protein BY996DRAFT_6430810 [Phakopsora pachyrhizi]CAH7674346.1 hypothetical protein PPACK8108_LOCUS9256 [Phakopsora pachyrhizi]